MEGDYGDRKVLLRGHAGCADLRAARSCAFPRGTRSALGTGGAQALVSDPQFDAWVKPKEMTHP